MTGSNPTPIPSRILYRLILSTQAVKTSTLSFSSSSDSWSAGSVEVRLERGGRRTEGDLEVGGVERVEDVGAGGAGPARST